MLLEQLSPGCRFRVQSQIEARRRIRTWARATAVAGPFRYVLAVNHGDRKPVASGWCNGSCRGDSPAQAMGGLDRLRPKVCREVADSSLGQPACQR